MEYDSAIVSAYNKELGVGDMLGIKDNELPSLVCIQIEANTYLFDHCQQSVVYKESQYFKLIVAHLNEENKVVA